MDMLSLVKDNTKVTLMKDNTKKINIMDLAPINGSVDKFMKDNLWMIKEIELGIWDSLMEIFI